MAEMEGEATDMSTSPVAGEPLPEWSAAVMTWGFGWTFYQFGFGAAFGILVLYTAYDLMKRLRMEQTRNRKRISLVFLSLLFLFGLTRCLFLCTDAYHTKKILPKVLLNVLWSVGSPCILTAYTLIFLVIRNIFHMRERFQGWYTVKNVAVLTVPYFLLAFLGELIVVFAPNFQGVTFTCQIFYVLISLMLCSFYSYVALLLWKNYKGTNIPARKESRLNESWTVADRNRSRRTLPMLKTCIATVIGGITLCGLQIYSMSGVYGVFSDVVYVPAWPWLILNYAMRTLELFLSFMLLVTARKRSGRQTSLRSGGSFVFTLKWSKSRVQTISVMPNATPSSNTGPHCFSAARVL